MSIRIIADSASDILPPYPAALSVIPMTITFGEKSFLDGVQLSHRKFYEKLIEEDTLPVTSQINPSVFESAFRDAVNNGEKVICITISSKLSGTYQNACIAAQDFPGQVFVIDSLNAAMGEAVLVRRALELSENGLSAEQAVRCLENEKLDIRLIALVDTLEYLKRGGRLSSATAFIGGLLSIKPVIAIQNGEVIVLGKARGSKNGNNLLAQEMEKAGGVDFKMPYCLGYSGLSDDMLRKYIEDSRSLWAEQADELPFCTIGGTIGTHVGPGAVGIAFFSKKA